LDIFFIKILGILNELFFDFFILFSNIFLNFFTLIFYFNLNFISSAVIKNYLNIFYKQNDYDFLKSDYFLKNDLNKNLENNFFEISNYARNQKVNDPVFKYDYKSGDYFPKFNQEMYNFLFSTIFNLTSGLKTSP
jgi:hypothetical protein